MECCFIINDWIIKYLSDLSSSDITFAHHTFVIASTKTHHTSNKTNAPQKPQDTRVTTNLKKFQTSHAASINTPRTSGNSQPRHRNIGRYFSPEEPLPPRNPGCFSHTRDPPAAARLYVIRLPERRGGRFSRQKWTSRRRVARINCRLPPFGENVLVLRGDKKESFPEIRSLYSFSS